MKNGGINASLDFSPWV